MDRLRNLARRAAAFRSDESGSVTVETLIMLPLLVWCFFAIYIFFDVFRVQGTNAKASYTIGDALSRETGYVTANYMNGVFGLQGLLLRTNETRDLQVTVYSYNASRDRYEVRWSNGIGSLPALTTTTLNEPEARDHLPVMMQGEVAILTRTRVSYHPIYDVGIAPFVFDEYTVTRPRFAPQLCWNSRENGNVTTATC
ncbi:MAG: hypothetical protein H3C51_12335 [Rubellimicrobium sp.]|nr:hypothetical protein [Rubellimicrobium sp.]